MHPVPIFVIEISSILQKYIALLGLWPFTSGDLNLDMNAKWPGYILKKFFRTIDRFFVTIKSVSQVGKGGLKLPPKHTQQNLAKPSEIELIYLIDEINRKESKMH